MKSLYWLRNDLRILDNKTLTDFCKTKGPALFVAAQTVSSQKSSIHRRQFYQESLFRFEKSVKSYNQVVLQTELQFFEFLNIFLKSNSIDALFFSKEYSFDERQEEEHVCQICETHGIQVHSSFQSTLIAQEDFPFSVQEMPFVFTDFRKCIEKSLVVQAPLEIPNQWPDALLNIFNKTELKCIPILEPQKISSPFHGGENFGLKRLDYYIWEKHYIEKYKETRNGLLDFNDSTKLSPWLNLGCVSPRTVFAEVKKFEEQVVQNDSTYWVLFELLWRDYFKLFSLKYGPCIFQIQGVNKDKKYTYTSNENIFLNWCIGQTEEPFVNANMKELNATGWMSNRGRQNVASYLIHQLKLPWVWGASYFEKKLIDYDADINWGNWLYLSGQGSDPRARQFDVKRQASIYDPLENYRKKWCPI